jgi:hypothetical protein
LNDGRPRAAAGRPSGAQSCKSAPAGDALSGAEAKSAAHDEGEAEEAQGRSCRTSTPSVESKASPRVAGGLGEGRIPLAGCRCVRRRSDDKVIQAIDWALGSLQALWNTPAYSWLARRSGRSWAEGEPWKYFNPVGNRRRHPWDAWGSRRFLVRGLDS